MDQFQYGSPDADWIQWVERFERAVQVATNALGQARLEELCLLWVSLKLNDKAQPIYDKCQHKDSNWPLLKGELAEALEDPMATFCPKRFGERGIGRGDHLLQPLYPCCGQKLASHLVSSLPHRIRDIYYWNDIILLKKSCDKPCDRVTELSPGYSNIHMDANKLCALLELFTFMVLFYRCIYFCSW